MSSSDKYTTDADRFAVNIIIKGNKRTAIIEDKVADRTYDSGSARLLIGFLEEAIKTCETVNKALA